MVPMPVDLMEEADTLDRGGLHHSISDPQLNHSIAITYEDGENIREGE